jgi:hemerythrin-like domain-containing protein
MKITDVLRAEHTVFHNLFDHIETTVPRHKLLAQVKSLALTLETLLRAHSKTEDELFIEPLEHCLEQIGQRDIFHEEHDEIDRQLVEVQNAKSLKASRQNLLKAVEASRKHFDKEERIVFPLAERVLKARTLTELGEVWMKRREAALR